LQRFALSPALDEGTKFIELFRCHLTVKLQVELQAGQFERFGKKEFGLKTRGGNAFFSKEFGGGIEDVEEAHKPKDVGGMRKYEGKSMFGVKGKLTVGSGSSITTARRREKGKIQKL